MTTRVLHVSDLHVGKREATVPSPALLEFVAELRPDAIVATGDLANRGRRDELERAAALLRAPGVPLLAVPGNHDIPYALHPRVTRPFEEWERVFGPAEPEHSSSGLVVVGLNSVRPRRREGGALSATSLRRAIDRLRAAPREALRVVALHHHLAAPPWRTAFKRPLGHRDEVLRSLAESRAELVVGGHVHQASVAELREFRVPESARESPLVLATAPGLGRPRPRRRGEAQGLNVYEADPRALTVRTLAWSGDEFLEVGKRTFPRLY